MSICFTRFLISGLGEPNIYHDLGDFTRIGDFTWRVSDCEELVGGYSQEMMWLVLGGVILLSIFHSPTFQRCFHLFRMSFRSKSSHF